MKNNINEINKYYTYHTKKIRHIWLEEMKIKCTCSEIESEICWPKVKEVNSVGNWVIEAARWPDGTTSYNQNWVALKDN